MLRFFLQNQTNCCSSADIIRSVQLDTVHTPFQLLSELSLCFHTVNSFLRKTAAVGPFPSVSDYDVHRCNLHFLPA